jgi:hypothetical protein
LRFSWHPRQTRGCRLNRRALTTPIIDDCKDNRRAIATIIATIPHQRVSLLSRVGLESAEWPIDAGLS